MAGSYYDDRSSLPSWRERSPPDSHPPPPPSWTGRDERRADHSYSATPPPPPPHGLLPIPSSFRVESLRKIVPAETIFDMPGRQERPSHVCETWITYTMCVCVCMVSVGEIIISVYYNKTDHELACVIVTILYLY